MLPTLSDTNNLVYFEAWKGFQFEGMNNSVPAVKDTVEHEISELYRFDLTRKQRQEQRLFVLTR